MMILKRSLSVHHSCTSIFFRMIDSCHSGLVYIYMLLIEALSFKSSTFLLLMCTVYRYLFKLFFVLTFFALVMTDVSACQHRFCCEVL